MPPYRGTCLPSTTIPILSISAACQSPKEATLRRRPTSHTHPYWPWDNGTRAYALNLRCRPSWSTFGWGFTYFTGKLTRFSDVSLRARRPSSLSMTCDTALVEPYVVPNLPVGHTRVSLQAKHAAPPHHTPRTARECSEQSPYTQARGVAPPQRGPQPCPSAPPAPHGLPAVTAGFGRPRAAARLGY